jgi:hypothetical protein
MLLSSGSGSLIRIGNADPDPDPGAMKLANKPDFQPFKMAFVPT